MTLGPSDLAEPSDVRPPFTPLDLREPYVSSSGAKENDLVRSSLPSFSDGQVDVGGLAGLERRLQFRSDGIRRLEA